MKIKTILIGFLMLLLVVNIANSDSFGKVYKLELNYNNGKINLLKVSLIEGYASENKIQNNTKYKLEILSFSNDALYLTNFNFPNILVIDVMSENGELSGENIVLNNSNKTLFLPYFERGKEINIYDSSDSKLLLVDISRLAIICNNDRICEKNMGENSDNCPNDCQKSEMNFIIVILIIASIIILTIALLFYKKGRVKYSYENPTVKNSSFS